MKVVVIGSGMAGLLAAKACEDMLGQKPTIITNHHPKPLSWHELAGIHVLHHNCGLELDDMLVTNMVILPMLDNGEPQLLAELSDWERSMANASYGSKVYGRRKATTSLMRMPAVIEGYDYVQAFNMLLNRYHKCVTLRRAIDEDSLYTLASENDFVVTTVPRHFVTPPWVKHPFSLVYVSDRPPMGFIPTKQMGDNFAVYNTEACVEWSRTSRVIRRGVQYWNTEYNTAPKFPVPGLRQVNKVGAGEHYAYPQNVLGVGRFGTWTPGVLAHQAYWDVVEELRRRV